MTNQRLKKFYLFFTSIFIFILHIPFVFAKNKPNLVLKPEDKKQQMFVPNEIPFLNFNAVTAVAKTTVYDSLKLNMMGLSQQAYQYAMQGFIHLLKTGQISNDRIISIADFSQSSTKKRFFVIDLKNFKVLFNTYVAHGQNSGAAMATQFSNTPESLQSSLGFFTTSSTYNGKNGYSMHLKGMEDGINDKAEERAIVMHGAPYINENIINDRGYIGRSWGCPAVPEKLNKPIIDKIKNGSCLFIYSKNSRYQQTSKILNS